MINKISQFINRKILRLSTPFDFTFLFIKKEGKVILGRRYINFFFLMGILFITFFAIGLAKGSLMYLKEKMKDPFIKWVSVGIPFSKADNIKEVMELLNKDKKAQEKYKYSNVTADRFFAMSFWDRNQKKNHSYTGRTIEKDNLLLAEILKNSNLISGRTFENDQEIGLIVTYKLLRELHYDKKTPVILHAFPDPLDDNLDRVVPLPIIAVVKDLPGLTDFFTTRYFFQQRKQPTSTGNPFDPAQANKIELLVFESKENAVRLKEAIENRLNTASSFQQYKPTVFNPELFNFSFYPCYKIPITILPDTSLVIRDQIYKEICQDRVVKGFRYVRFYDYTAVIGSHKDSLFLYDFLTIKFENIGQVNDFKEFLLKRFEIRMDMAQIKTLENYNFISNLTQIISIILIIFSILSICLFISNLLRNHLEKIRMNIGTFKAFGLDNASLESIYLTIISIFVFTAMVFAFIISWGLGILGGARVILYLINHEIEKEQNYFDLLNYWSLISFLLITITSYLVLKYTTRKIFRQTPGDLIYERNE